MNDCNLGSLLTRCLRMEELAFDFYGYLIERFSDQAELVTQLKRIRADEADHVRAVKEVLASLTPVRLESHVDEEVYEDLSSTVDYMERVMSDGLDTVDDVYEAITVLEHIEFDVVMKYVDYQEIRFEFTRNYLRNQSVEHTNRIYRALRHLA